MLHIVDKNIMERFSLISKYKFYFHARDLILSIIFLGIILHFMLLGGSPFLCSALYVLYFVVLIILRYDLINDENIVISEHDITCTTSGMMYKAEWADIENIKNVFTSLAIRQDCLIVDKSRVKIISMSAFGSRTIWFRQKVNIPLSQFSDPWRESYLGGLIKRYAPHLFETKVSS